MNPLDKLTANCTVFADWQTLLVHLQAGYVPTISNSTRRQRLLTRAIKAHGFRVFVREAN